MFAFRKVPSTFVRERESPFYLCEDYDGDEQPQFAIISPDGTQICDWMNCKDFIQDTVWGAKNNVPYSIYGWNFRPSRDKVSKRYLLLALRWTSVSVDKLKAALFNVKATIENLEKRIGIPAYQRTRFSRVIKGSCEYSHFVIYGSPQWMHCVGTVSFFSWLIRASLLNEGGTFESLTDASFVVNKDAYYLRSGKAFIDQLLAHGIESFEPDWDNKRVNKVHHNGFVNYAREIKKKRPTRNPQDAVGSFTRGDEEDWDF